MDPQIFVPERILAVWLSHPSCPYNAPTIWAKWTENWTLSSRVSSSVRGQKQNWSHLSMISGESGMAVDYLSLLSFTPQGQSQFVFSSSSPWLLLCGMPQNLVLSPLLFINYMKPLGKIIHHKGMRYHQYADNAQFYISIVGDWNAVVTAVLQYVEALGIWTGDNRPWLNNKIN